MGRLIILRLIKNACNFLSNLVVRRNDNLIIPERNDRERNDRERKMIERKMIERERER